MGGDTQLTNILQCFYTANRTSTASTEGKDQSVQHGTVLGRGAQGICGSDALGQLIDVKGNPKGALEQLYKAFEQAEKPRLGNDARKVQDMARNAFKTLEHVTADNVASFREQLDGMARERLDGMARNRASQNPHVSISASGAQRPQLERSDSKVSLASLLSQLGDDDSDSDSDDDEPMRPQPTRQRSMRSSDLLSSLSGLKKESPTATPLPFDPKKEPEHTSMHRSDSTASLNRSVRTDGKVQHIEGDSGIERTVFEKTRPESVAEQIQELAENLELIYQDGKYDYATNFRPLATLAETIAEYEPDDFGRRGAASIRSMLASPILSNLETQEFATSKAENLYRRSVHSFSPEFRTACENLDRLEEKLLDVRNTADKLSTGIRRNRRRSFLGSSSKTTPALTRIVQQEERLAAEVDKAQAALAIAKDGAPANEITLRDEYEQVPAQRKLLETLLKIRDGLEDALLE